MSFHMSKCSPLARLGVHNSIKSLNLIESSCHTVQHARLSSASDNQKPIPNVIIDHEKRQSRNNLVKKEANHLSSTLVDNLRRNLVWLNGQYDKLFGIEEIRKMQQRVIDAESQFVNFNQQRKICQDRIENFKQTIKSIRDKLDITPRQSDNYLKLITEEHKLLREQLSHDEQLSQLKDKEQWSLENLSKLLRQSHELERLRQERAKYWQIISLGLSVAGGVVALFAQRVRSEKKELNAMSEKIQAMQALNETIFSELLSMMNSLRSVTNKIADDLSHKQISSHASRESNRKSNPNIQQQTWISWLSWVSGFGYVKSRLIG